MHFVRIVMNPGGKGIALENLAKNMVGKRLKVGSMTKDLFYHLVSHIALVPASFVVLRAVF